MSEPTARVPSIEAQIVELEEAGWRQETRFVWRAPDGTFHVGPHGAWRKMNRATPTEAAPPYESLLKQLRDPHKIDDGFHGYHADPLCISAANAIEELQVGLRSQIEISNGLRTRCESLEKRATQPSEGPATIGGHGPPFKPEPQSSLVTALQSEITEKDRLIAELEAQLRNASAETACCIKFLETELFWEDFRAEGFIGKDEVSASTRNCQKLAAFLKECGNHGAEILAELAEANRNLELMPALEAALAECISGLNDIAYVGDPRTTKMANATLLKIRPPAKP